MKSSGTGNVEIEICDFKDKKIHHIWWIFFIQRAWFNKQWRTLFDGGRDEETPLCCNQL